MQRTTTRILSGAAVSIVAGGIAAVAVAGIASAHTPVVSATCTDLHVSLTSYPSGSTADVVLDGADQGTTTFGREGYDRHYALDVTATHTWSVAVTSGDGDRRFDRTYSGASDAACVPTATATPTPSAPATPEPTGTPTPSTTPTPSAPATPTASTPPTAPATPTATTPPTPSATPVVAPPTPLPATGSTPTATATATATATPAVVGGTDGGTGPSATGELAYTGSPVGLGVGAGAAVAVALGGGLLGWTAVRRRRSA
ncbi:hypothetical protein BIU97_14555 [Curtobacterium sp. MCBA15_009]|uniref:hypothetical protein n=1 Tax=Curtobacterium sp. MCBA15_009 TaxID=1898737 RepID=UPI0008DD88CB|nr:hypothetical protein [Curtobacterium sp. MCBA15_009]OII15390.1 hypothetical protein BIU97_14555 [Curtobacterium sp. MCBA15_009]